MFSGGAALWSVSLLCLMSSLRLVLVDFMASLMLGSIVEVGEIFSIASLISVRSDSK
jgi:hypothetical protein